MSYHILMLISYMKWLLVEFIIFLFFKKIKKTQQWKVASHIWHIQQEQGTPEVI
jgi:hypothetical protein